MQKIILTLLVWFCGIISIFANTGSNYVTYTRGINISTNMLKFSDQNGQSGILFTDGTAMYTYPTNFDRIGVTNIVFSDGTSMNTYPNPTNFNNLWVTNLYASNIMTRFLYTTNIIFNDGTSLTTYPTNFNHISVTNINFPDGTSLNTAYTFLETNQTYSIVFTTTNVTSFTNTMISQHFCLEKGYLFIDGTNFSSWPIDKWVNFRLYSSPTTTYENTLAEYTDKRMSSQRVQTNSVTAGTKAVSVQDASVFNVDDPVVICYTNTTYQLNKITDKISNTLYFQDGLTINIEAYATNTTIASVIILGNLNLFDSTGATNLYGNFEFEATNKYNGVVKFIYRAKN